MAPKSDRRLLRIGSELRRARERAGLSQRELAARAGTSQAQLSFIERGMQEPGIGTFLTIVGILNADPADILGESGADSTGRPSP